MSESKVVTKGQVTIVPLTEKWFEDAKVTDPNRNHLLKSLHNLEAGIAPTPSFKLYGSSEIEIVEKFLDSVPWKTIEVPPNWEEYEYSRLKKFGPQGGFPPWSEVSDIFHQYQENLAKCTVDDTILTKCKKQYETIYCQMLSVDQSLALLLASNKIEDRAAGCRWFELKKTDPDAQRYAVADFRSGLYLAFFMYTFEKWEKQKSRIFMPGPFACMLDQARFVQPFLLAIQNDIRAKRSKSKLVQHADKIGFDECFAIMGEEISEFFTSHDPKCWIIVYGQGDFYKMDTTCGSEQYNKLFIPIMATSFRFGKDSNPYNELQRSMLMTTSIPIASPEGMMVGEHGTGSGMENTNIGEGCSNDYYQLKLDSNMREKAPELRGKWFLLSRRVNGDDSAYVWVLHKSCDVGKFEELIQESANSAADECGFRINEKWRLGTDFGLFCQNGFYYDIKSRTVKWFYPSALILNGILNPKKEYKKKDWDKDYRDLDIAEKLDNGKGLPYFNQLIDYVDNGLKYPLLGESEPETNRILSKYESYRALQSLDERYNRQEWNPSSSPTVNYILSKRDGQ